MQTINAYILAGGRSSRFGSDKARAMLDDQPLIRLLAEQLRTMGLPVVAVADREGKYDDLNLTTIRDDHPGLGPLAGLERALRHALENPSRVGLSWILLVSCDLVEIRRARVEELTQPVRSGEDVSIVAFREKERWHPLPGLYHTALLPEVTRRLLAGRRSMQALLDESRAVALPLPADWPETPQINTPADLDSATKRHRSR